MSNRHILTTLKAGLLLAVMAGFVLPASAQQDVMKVCGAEWQKAKSKNKGEAPKGMTWKTFLSDCRKRLAASNAKAPAKRTSTKGKATKATTRTTSPQDVMKTCGAEWQKVKDKNKGAAPKGMTWAKFLSDCRKRQPKRPSTAKASSSRKKTKVAKSKTSGESMMSACGKDWRELKEKNKVPKGMTWTKYLGDCSKRYEGKFKPTQSQLAMYRRIRKCGTMWREAKDKGRLKKGITWPKYWSDCNDRLKPKN